MAHIHRIVSPGRTAGTVLSETGTPLVPPEDWAFLPAGDAAITKGVKARGVTWVVRERRGRREISKGIWAAAAHILASQVEVEAKRSNPEYDRRRAKELDRREAKQKTYVQQFLEEVVSFLGFHPRYQVEANLLAEKVTAHATPVGSGTVARTSRIPVARRAEAAVIAWMRHQTTAYDVMSIARIKGKRREIRGQLAAQSVSLLQAYRQGWDIAETCPLKIALG
ncbi:MAG: hypothetical protein FD168_1856 [Desulfobulbaceae bacterium]|nr:MAG: hypothetical protein FD168_1856 [Desulfobulbaceae bacterium]